MREHTFFGIESLKGNTPGKFEHIDDATLASQVRDALLTGNHKVVEEFHAFIHPVLMRHALRKTRGNHDSANEAIASFWMDLLSKDLLGKFRGSSKLTTYLVQILDYKISDQRRKYGRECSLSGFGAEGDDAENNSNSFIDWWVNDHHDIGEIFDAFRINADGFISMNIEQAELGQRVQMLREALVLLGERYPGDLTIVGLRLKGLRYQEIANLLGKSEITLRKANSRALKRLREIMENLGHT